ncbi:Hypothetical protein POVN_LOCUS214, partial [uncultured virus]
VSNLQVQGTLPVQQSNPIKLYEIGTKDYTLTMRPNQYEGLRTFFLIAFSIILVLLVIFLIWVIYSYVTKPREPRPPIPPVPVTPVADQDVGASTLGAASYQNGIGLLTENACVSSNGVWSGGSSGIAGGPCLCKQPFFGPTCQRQAHDADYFGLGLVAPPGSLAYEKQAVEFDGNLSFNGEGFDDKSCTGRCDDLNNCLGVEFDGKTCALITSNPMLAADGVITVDPAIDPQIYLYRNGVRPVIKDRVFGYTGNRPLRFWATRSDVYSMQAGQVYPLVTPPPERLVNDGSLIGVWTMFQFGPTEFPRLLAGGAGVYVDRGAPSSDYPLNLPATFAGQKLWVMYAKGSNLQGRRVQYYN